MEYNMRLNNTGRNAQCSLKSVPDILADISDENGLVNYITSECHTEIIKIISFCISNNNYRMNKTSH
jgi:hypothetical protein